MRTKKTNIKDRLLERRKIIEDCWEWQGCLNSTGYGYIGVESKTIRVHRVAYTEWKGEIPKQQEFI